MRNKRQQREVILHLVKKQKSESAATEDMYVCVNEYKGSLNVHSNCRLMSA